MKPRKPPKRWLCLAACQTTGWDPPSKDLTIFLLVSPKSCEDLQLEGQEPEAGRKSESGAKVDFVQALLTSWRGLVLDPRSVFSTKDIFLLELLGVHFRSWGGRKTSLPLVHDCLDDPTFPSPSSSSLFSSVRL